MKTQPLPLQEVMPPSPGPAGTRALAGCGLPQQALCPALSMQTTVM
jgi:hypothetical protein